MLPLLDFSFHKTESLVNSHAGSGTVAFVLTHTGSPPLLIMDTKEITCLLPAYTTHHTHPEEQYHTSREGDAQDLGELLQMVLHWFSGQIQNLSDTSMGNLPKHIPSAPFIHER